VMDMGSSRWAPIIQNESSRTLDLKGEWRLARASAFEKTPGTGWYLVTMVYRWYI
jgi:hypothetical protein